MPVLAQSPLKPDNVSATFFSDTIAARSALAVDSLRASGRLRLQVRGESMLPTLWPGDVVEIASCSLEDARPGEIVLAFRDGRLFLHRFLARGEFGGFLLRGDSMPGPDPEFPSEALLGRLVRQPGLSQDPAKEPAEKLGFRLSAPKGAVDFERPTASLKRCPDTKPGFSANCKASPIRPLRPWSWALGRLLCHFRLARRLALEIHSRRKQTAGKIRNAGESASFDSMDVGAL